jgi:hypothetical protein
LVLEVRVRLSQSKLFIGEPDDAFRRYEAVLAAAVIYSGPYEPPAAGDATAVQQAVRQHSVQYSLGWHGRGDAGKLAFMQDAMRLPHPANHEHEHLPKDLLRVIQFVTGKREASIAWRQARLALLLKCEQALRPLNERIIASLKPAVRHVVGKYNLAYMACIVNGTKFQNVHIVPNFVHGFPVFERADVQTKAGGAFGFFHHAERVDHLPRTPGHWEGRAALMEARQLIGAAFRARVLARRAEAPWRLRLITGSARCGGRYGTFFS